VVLVLVALLTALVVELVHLAGGQRVAAERTLEDLQLSYALRSGYYRALLYLQADAETAADVDTLREPWAQPIRFRAGEADVLVQIEDAERFINVSKLIRPNGDRCARVANILTNLGISIGQDTTVPERLADYMDADGTGPFESGAKNALLFHPEEVLRIPDVPPAVWLGSSETQGAARGYLEFITIWPRVAAQQCPPPGQTGPSDMKVNLNTAGAEVLSALFDPPNPSYAQALVSWRQGTAPDGTPNAFRSIADVGAALNDPQAASALQDVAVFRSRYFIVKVKTRVRGVEEGHVFVVERASGNRFVLQTHYRMPEFLYAQAPES
jgi:type II secretory pathway component PulK